MKCKDLRDGLRTIRDTRLPSVAVRYDSEERSLYFVRESRDHIYAQTFDKPGI